MGSRFPKRRNPEYRRWIREQECVLTEKRTLVRLTINDIQKAVMTPRWVYFWEHHCWGPIDPAHVNETQARGAYDVGEVIPLCRGAHRQLDQVLGPAEFAQVTGLDLSSIAAGLALKYAEQGGTVAVWPS